MSELLTLLPYELPGAIYRSPLPLSPMFDPVHQLLDAYVRVGVNVVVMLTPEEEVQALTGVALRQRYQELGFEVIYAPVPDFKAPATGDFQVPIQQVLRAARAGQTVVIHCHAGIGRTGTFAACLAKIVFDMSGEEAVSWVRQAIPHAVEDVEQYLFIKTFRYLQD